MSFRPIVLPQPPPVAGFAGIPEIFDKGVTTCVRRVVVIGNGVPGAEHQSIGLIRTLGVGSSFEIYRVVRPQGGLNEYLRWLPLAIHKRLNLYLNQFQLNASYKLLVSLLSGSFRNQRLIAGDSKAMASNGGEGLSMLQEAQEADAKLIAARAIQQFAAEGPTLVVASGRDTVQIAIEVKKLASSAVFVVQIQHPHCDVSLFDLVITPSHDYHGYTPQAKLEVSEKLLNFIRPPPPERNVVLTLGALHEVDAVALRSAASSWHQQLAPLPRPMITVNIGGPQKYCRYGVNLAHQLATALKQSLMLNGGSIRISFSRRTPLLVKDFILKEFESHDDVYIWDGRGPNPHIGNLAWADAFVVTADSVSMLSEACSTGKPVYVVGADFCTWKLKEFIGALRKRGALRTFTGFENLGDSWSYPPLRDNEEAAAKVREAIAVRGWSL